MGGVSEETMKQYAEVVPVTTSVPVDSKTTDPVGAEGLIAGLQFLIKKANNSYVETNAEHDVIFAGPELREDDFSEEEKKQMVEFGWHWSKEADSWAYFT